MKLIRKEHRYFWAIPLAVVLKGKYFIKEESSKKRRLCSNEIIN